MRVLLLTQFSIMSGIVNIYKNDNRAYHENLLTGFQEIYIESFPNILVVLDHWLCQMLSTRKSCFVTVWRHSFVFGSEETFPWNDLHIIKTCHSSMNIYHELSLRCLL